MTGNPFASPVGLRRQPSRLQRLLSLAAAVVAGGNLGYGGTLLIIASWDAASVHIWLGSILLATMVLFDG